MKKKKKIISWIYAMSILSLIILWAYFGSLGSSFVRENIILVIVYLLPGILFIAKIRGSDDDQRTLKEKICDILGQIYASGLIIGLFFLFLYKMEDSKKFIDENTILVIVYLLPGVIFFIYAFFKTIEALGDEMGD